MCVCVYALTSPNSKKKKIRYKAQRQTDIHYINPNETQTHISLPSLIHYKTASSKLRKRECHYKAIQSYKHNGETIYIHSFASWIFKCHESNDQHLPLLLLRRLCEIRLDLHKEKAADGLNICVRKDIASVNKKLVGKGRDRNDLCP